jgi:nitrate/TMAO reductase-like tetraheme cytochrome c subunit
MCSPNDLKWYDMLESEQKTCTKCHSTKSLNEFYMARVWRGLTPSAPKPMAQCKACHRAAARSRYAQTGGNR